MKIDALTATASQLKKNQQLTAKNGDFQKMVVQAQEKQDETQLKEACQQMEALFINQLLSQMRKGIPKNDLLPQSSATRIFQDMLDAEYSKEMAKSPDNLGIADILYQDLTRKWKTAVPPSEIKE